MPCCRVFLGKFDLWIVRPIQKQTCRDVTRSCFRFSTTITYRSHQHNLIVINVFGLWTDLEKETYCRVQVSWKWLEYFFHLSSFCITMFLRLDMVVSSLAASEMSVPDPHGVYTKVDASSYWDACVSKCMTLPFFFFSPENSLAEQIWITYILLESHQV